MRKLLKSLAVLINLKAHMDSKQLSFLYLRRHISKEGAQTRGTNSGLAQSLRTNDGLAWPLRTNISLASLRVSLRAA